MSLNVMDLGDSFRDPITSFTARVMMASDSLLEGKVGHLEPGTMALSTGVRIQVRLLKKQLKS